MTDITASHRKGDGSLDHVLRNGNYAYGSNIDRTRRSENISFIQPVSVRQAMENCFGESIREYNAELTPSGQKKKPSRQILERDSNGKPIKDEDGNYIQGNMLDWVFGDELKEVTNENKMLRKPSKGGKLNPDTGKIEGAIKGQSNYNEELIQYGDSDTCRIGTPNGEKAIKALSLFVEGVPELGIKSMQERLPQFHFIAIELHNDEYHFREESGGDYIKDELKKSRLMYKKAEIPGDGKYNRYPSTPHLHTVYIPWATGYTRGPDKQIGYDRSLKQMGHDDFQAYRDSEREIMYRIGEYVFGTDDYRIIRNKSKTNEDIQHLDISEYKYSRDAAKEIEILEEEKKDLQSELDAALNKQNETESENEMLKKRLSEEISKFRHAYDKQRFLNKNLESEVETLKKERFNLRVEIEGLKSEVETLKKELLAEKTKPSLKSEINSPPDKPNDIKTNEMRITGLFKEKMLANIKESRAREDKKYGISGNSIIKDIIVQQQKPNDINRQTTD